MHCLAAPGPASDRVCAGRRGRAVLFRAARPPRLDPRDRRGQGAAGRDPGSAGRGLARGRAHRQVAPDAAGDRRGDADAARRGRSASAGLAHRRTGRGGKRTVWQQFADMEALLVEASRRDLEILMTMLRPIDAGLPLDERITRFVSRNARIYERMAPGWLAARLHEPFSAELRRSKQRNSALGKAEIEAAFAPELASPRRPAADPADHRPGRSRLLAVLGVTADRRSAPAWRRRRVLSRRCSPRR